ncbi:MAG: serine/threonine protein kinase [Lentisphaeraceae bacterium]|nr:serine/threonine protein kinase [Lentisphaeraceae bacterium]
MSEEDVFLNKKFISLCSEINMQIEEQSQSINDAVHQLFDQMDEGGEKYTDKVFLAEGGMKTISRVSDSSSLRSVAMAELKSDEITPKKIFEFYHEARINALLEHPNIVPVYEIGHKDGIPYFIMKEIQGETLSGIIHKLNKKDEKCLTEYNLENLLSIFLKVCDAVAYAHSKNIVHLDLKPDNIHIGKFGEVLVIDWGLAKNLGDHQHDKHSESISTDIDTSQTLDGMVKGTIGYMAPEQARGENSLKDQSTDIYSLGAILYFILSFKAPYENEGIHESLMKIALGKYKKLDGEKYPQSLIAVVEKAMSIKKAHRYGEVEGLRHEIQLFLQGFATNAQDAKPAELAKLFFKRNTRLLTIILVFLSLLFIASTAFVINLQKKEKEAQHSAKVAKENEAEALSLLNDLQKSNKARSKLQDLSVPLSIKRYEELSSNNQFEQAFDALNKVYHENITQNAYWYHRGSSYLGSGQFDKSIESYKKAKSLAKSKLKIKKIDYLIQSILEAKESEETLDQLTKLALSLKRIEPKISANLYYYAYKNLLNDGSDKIQFLYKALMAHNPGAQSMNYSYRYEEEGFSIDISNNENLVDISPLCGFPVSKLNVSYCENIRNYIWLRNSNLRELNISGINSKYYHPLVNFKYLKRLIVKDAFYRFNWIVARGVDYADFTGSLVDIFSLETVQTKSLNLCKATAMATDYVFSKSGLKSLCIPERKTRKPSNKNLLKERKIKILFCECKSEQECNFEELSHQSN